MTLKRLDIGKSGERFAAKYLKNKGYRILHRNYSTRSGEIDLIAQHKNILVFVEIKTRKSSFLETPLIAVTAKKQKNISKVAQEYLCQENKFDCAARFDVISVNYYNKKTPEIEHIENAFDLCYGN